MSATRTIGITTDRKGDYLIDKRHLGERICLRLRQCTIDEAESRLKQELAHLEVQLAKQRVRYCADGGAGKGC